jgi:hypothetical protein
MLLVIIPIQLRAILFAIVNTTVVSSVLFNPPLYPAKHFINLVENEQIFFMMGGSK